jgi:hypothetical protein
MTIRRPSPVERCGPEDLPYSGRIYRTGGTARLVGVDQRFSSYLDGSPTPPWVEECRRRTEAQRQAAAYTLAPASSEPSEPRKPRRDWLATKEEKPWRL